MEIDPYYFRPTEVHSLHADPAKAQLILKWVPNVCFRDLVRIMVDVDLELIGLPSIGEGRKILEARNSHWQEL